MPDWVSIALTAVFGVFVFAVGQIIQRIFIEPMHDVRRTVGRIAHALTFYQNLMPRTADPFGEGATVGVDPEEMKEAGDEIRKLAADLRAFSLVLPCYRLFAAARLVPKRQGIEEASTHLMGWANSLGREPNAVRAKEIAKALKLRIPGLFG